MSNFSALYKNFFVLSFIFALVYFFINFYFTNNALINQTILGDYSLSYKTSLIYYLFMGLSNALGTVNLFFLVLISILTGLNLAIISNKLLILKNSGAHLMLSGGSLMGVASTGCASCGLPLLGVLGLSGSIAHLPFHGTELSLIAVGLLLISFGVLLRNQVKECKI